MIANDVCTSDRGARTAVKGIDMATAISTTSLTKYYGSTCALRDLTIEVPGGSIFGFLGPNGAGKTTAMKVIAGLTRATSGTATVNGIPVRADGRHRRELGYLAQEPKFYGWMTGRETLEYVARFYGPEAGRASWIGELLDRVGLGDAAGRATKEYSGGMLQRLGIAQALVGQPAVVLLDEPVSALDPIGRRDMLHLMLDLKGETTIFYSTHILDDVERVSDYVAILDAGRVVATAPTRELMASFATDRLLVVLVGADESTEAALAELPAVRAVRMVARDGDVWRYEIQSQPESSGTLQRAITRFAADTGLTLMSNTRETLDLESVFLRVVSEREVLS